MRTQKIDPLFKVLGPRYTSEYFRNEAEELGKELAREGIVVFNDFLSEKAISALKREADFLKPKAYRSSSAYNLYVKPTDPDFPEDSPRNRMFRTTKGCIPNDLLPQVSLLRFIYNSPIVRSFLCKLLKVSVLYPYADALSSININYYDRGDALQWHFDNADFAITLLVKQPIKGGVYQYFTDMRTKNGVEDYEYARKCIDGEVCPQEKSLREGGLMIFRGNQSLHRVTEVEEGERVLITFNFNTKPDVSLSENSRQTFFGRTK
ncbi:2OG-Fe(II) oxygenase [Candidatus Peribacteria bacterium]|nr:2OG-Fe(II) oxygenase [Candidatus Peribacteria bacterium]